MYADPPAWIFPVQACDYNYITLKQIQIIDTLVAKFRKVHDATPQHDTFKTPGQASPNPRKYLCSKLPAPTKPGAGVVIALPTAASAYTAREALFARLLFLTF